MKKIFSPFGSTTKKVFYTLVIGEIAIAVFLYAMFRKEILPDPIKILSSFVSLFSNREFYDNLFVSISLTFKGMGISILLSMAISYFFFIPVFKPVTLFTMLCRFLTLTGLVFLFNLLTSDGSQLKIWLLVFGIVPFLVTTLVSDFKSINVQEFELCKTLQMNAWETWWEVVIIGRLDKIVDTVRQNFAIAWLMITMVEGLSRSEGGLGVMLLNVNKYLDLKVNFAILLVIFIIGLLFDFLLAKIRHWIFPYTKLQVMK